MKSRHDNAHFGWRIRQTSATDEAKILVVASLSSEEETATSDPVFFTHPPQCCIKGVTCPGTLSESKWIKLNDEVQYRNTDILIVSYPKSGTTLLEQCVLLLLNGGDKALLNPANKNVYSPSSSELGGKIWLEACIDQDPETIKLGEEFRTVSLREFDEMPSPRLIKSHAPTQLLLGMNGENLELELGLKIIVISRNPLDSCVSRYYHAFNPFKIGWPFPAWAAVWLTGNSSYGSWFDWVRGWSEQAKKNVDQILWIQYEDMIRNPENEIRKIQLFLNISSADNKFIDNVKRGCSFDSMKKQSMAKESSGDFQGHLRKGIIGDWKNHFTEDMKKEFLDTYNKELVGSGLIYDFGEN